MADKITAVLAAFPGEPDDAWEFMTAEGMVRAEDHDAYVDIVNQGLEGDALATALGQASLLEESAYDDDDGIAERAESFRAT
jgi:hypothetical protein